MQCDCRKESEGVRKHKRAEHRAPQMARLLPDTSRLERISEGIQTKRAVKIPHEKVERLNSLQVECIDLVFSSIKDFELVERMIKFDAKHREGRLF